MTQEQQECKSGALKGYNSVNDELRSQKSDKERQMERIRVYLADGITADLTSTFSHQWCWRKKRNPSEWTWKLTHRGNPLLPSKQWHWLHLILCKIFIYFFKDLVKTRSSWRKEIQEINSFRCCGFTQSSTSRTFHFTSNKSFIAQASASYWPEFIWF